MVNRLFGGAMVAAVLLSAACGVADGPGDNLPESVRPIPPPGIELDEATQRRLLDGAAALVRDVATVEHADDADRAEVLVFARAVRMAVEDRFLYVEKEVEQAERLLDRGRERLATLRAGASGARLVTWGSGSTDGPRLAVGGFRSRIDGSVQPYGLVVPAGFDPADTRPRRLDVWLHGRGEKMSEVAFLAQRLATVGEIAPPDTIVLHPYGRYSNAFKFAGETDVLEAIDHVKTLFPIDDDRIAIRGFSMGGAGCWQLAVHLPGMWLAATPGAGFAETREFLRTFQQQVFEPTPAQARLLHWYDCPDWANNLRHLPTIAYSGELDKQKQAADAMVAACETRGFEIPHVIGPQTAHKIHPDAKAEIEAFVAQAAEQGRPAVPREIDFTTYTLRSPTHTWLTINGLGEHWSEARVRAAVRAPRMIKITTTNVTAFSLDIPLDAGLLQAGAPVAVQIDGATRDVPATSGPRWQAVFTKQDGAWRLGTADAGTGGALRKRPGLQGPIDDAFMDAFVFVGPAPGNAGASPAERWAADECARAKREWRRHFRGDVVERLPADVSADDIATKHLVLFGTPESNALVAKVLSSLPVRREGDAWALGAARSPAATSLPVLIHPNPLNPDRYVVLNSGFTFREYAYLNNARQIPMLPDWALVSVVEGRDAQLPGTILAEGFFDERWQPR
ncbi:MAG: prolyl oligopeptidase family serine peptidase [Planctomycetia bacterium]